MGPSNYFGHISYANRQEQVSGVASLSTIKKGYVSFLEKNMYFFVFAYVIVTHVASLKSFTELKIEG